MDMVISGETLRYVILANDGFHHNQQEGVVSDIYDHKKGKGPIAIMVCGSRCLKRVST